MLWVLRVCLTCEGMKLLVGGENVTQLACDEHVCVWIGGVGGGGVATCLN